MLLGSPGPGWGLAKRWLHFLHRTHTRHQEIIHDFCARDNCCSRSGSKTLLAGNSTEASNLRRRDLTPRTPEPPVRPRAMGDYGRRSAPPRSEIAAREPTVYILYRSSLRLINYVSPFWYCRDSRGRRAIISSLGIKGRCDLIAGRHREAGTVGIASVSPFYATGFSFSVKVSWHCSWTWLYVPARLFE